MGSPDGSVVGGGAQVPSGARARGNWQTGSVNGAKIWPAGQNKPPGCDITGTLGAGRGAAEACPQRLEMAISAKWPRAASLLAGPSSSSTK